MNRTALNCFLMSALLAVSVFVQANDSVEFGDDEPEENGCYLAGQDFERNFSNRTWDDLEISVSLCYRGYFTETDVEKGRILRIKKSIPSATLCRNTTDREACRQKVISYIIQKRL